MYNRAILIGRLVADPEMRTTPNGINVATFRIAVDRPFSKNAEKKADFITIVAWRQQAEFICKYFAKGSMIAIVGSIQSRSWDSQDGKKQYATEVIVDEAYFTGSKAETGTQSAPANQSFNQPDADQAPFDEFDATGFAAMGGSEDDLPF